MQLNCPSCYNRNIKTNGLSRFNIFTCSSCGRKFRGIHADPNWLDFVWKHYVPFLKGYDAANETHCPYCSDIIRLDWPRSDGYSGCYSPENCQSCGRYLPTSHICPNGCDHPDCGPVKVGTDYHYMMCNGYKEIEMAEDFYARTPVDQLWEQTELAIEADKAGGSIAEQARQTLEAGKALKRAEKEKAEKEKAEKAKAEKAKAEKEKEEFNAKRAATEARAKILAEIAEFESKDTKKSNKFDEDEIKKIAGFVASYCNKKIRSGPILSFLESLGKLPVTKEEFEDLILRVKKHLEN